METVNLVVVESDKVKLNGSIHIVKKRLISNNFWSDIFNMSFSKKCAIMELIFSEEMNQDYVI